MKADTSITEFTDQIKQYVRTTTEIIKLEILKRTVVMSSFIIIQLILWFMIGLVLLMFSIAMGFYLSRYYNDYILGFGIVGTCFTGMVFILLLIGPKRLEKLMQNKLLRQMYEEKPTS
jgi:vacuolar-type H+-ATPase subunit I/STV1